jgi:hypothetical protein
MEYPGMMRSSYIKCCKRKKGDGMNEGLSGGYTLSMTD